MGTIWQRCTLVLLAMAAGLGDVSSQGLSKGSCECSDVPLLQARYCLAKAGVDEWDRLIEVTSKQEKKNNSVELLTEDIREDLKHCVNQKLTIHRKSFTGTGDPGTVIDVPIMGGNTDVNCNVKVDAPNACLKEVLEKHESGHQAICRAKTAKDAAQDDGLFGFLRFIKSVAYDPRSGESSVSYMTEERHSYAQEMTDIEKRLTDLFESGKCPSAMFHFNRPSGRKFSLTPCPKPNEKDWPLDCKRN